MALNPNIILGLRSPKIDTPDPVDQYAKGLQLKGLMSQQALSDQAVADDRSNRDAFASSGGDSAKYLQALASGGNYKAYQAAQKADLERQKATADIAHLGAQTNQSNASAGKSNVDAQVATIERVSSILSTAKDPQSYAVARQAVGRMFPQALANLPEQYDPMLVQSTIAGGMKKSEQLKAEHDAATLAQTVVRDRNTNANAQEGHNIQRAAQRQAESHFQAGQNTPQYMETDSGLVALPKKLGPGQAPVGTPVMGANGQPLGKPLKDIPASVNTAIITNTQNLSKAQQALSLLQGNSVGAMTGDKEATGWKGMLPGSVLNRADPSGVDTRAAIADLGSMVLHDRSGAAVTASEYPRLQPFIPTATDDATTAAKKLRRFIQVYEQENQALQQTYSKDQGYKPNPVRASGGVVDLHTLPTGKGGSAKQINYSDLKN